MQAVQEIELFELSETEQLRADLVKLRKELQNTRKGLFSRHDTLQKMYEDQAEEIAWLKGVIEENGIPTVRPVYVQAKERPKCEMIFV